MKKIKLIEVKSEIAAGTRGASLGIDAMKIAALKKGSDFFGTHESLEIENENQQLYKPVNTPHAIRIEGVAKMYERVCEAVEQEMKAGTYPIMLAGDHSTAGGTIAGIKKANPESRVGVIWVDAHADLHSPYTTPSGNMHGMPLATALNEDNLPNKVNDPDEETQKLWDRMKNTGGIAPKIKPEDLVFIGVRDTEAPEDELIKKYGIRNFSIQEVREEGPEAIGKAALKELTACDLIYVSFDVDSMDEEISRGTGTPVPIGLQVEEAKSLMTTLVSNPKVGCFEIVEVNPTLDDKINLMAENAFSILGQTTKAVEKR